MKSYFCLFALFAALAAAPRSSAQQSTLPDRFGNWRVDSCQAQSGRPALAEEAREREFRSCQFSSAGHTATISAGRYGDPSSAYEMYTSLLVPGMAPSALGEYTAVDGDKLVALAGDIVLEIDNPRNVPTPDLQQLFEAVKGRAHQSPLPPIRGFLPREDLLNGTQRYALGPIAFRSAAEQLGQPEFGVLADNVGFSKGAEAMFARYKPGALLILIDYPTPQLAELHLRHLQVSLPDAAIQGGANIQRKGSLLSIVLAPAMPGYAATLRDAINFETQVTWNEPSSSATDPPWSVVLYRIFVGTAAFMILAVICGVIFGGLRVVTKRVLPGKIFDRPKQIEILQLGLSGKTIDPSDFY